MDKVKYIPKWIQHLGLDIGAKDKYSKKSFVEIHDGNAWHGSNMRKTRPGRLLQAGSWIDKSFLQVR